MSSSLTRPGKTDPQTTADASPFGVTVIVAAYQAEATISASLESLRAQTMLNWDAIVVDDGSTDDTAAVVKGIADRDSRIRLVRQANAGPNAARNVAVRAASHPWLLFLDADDTIAPEWLERAGEVLGADSSLDAVVCGWSVVDSAGRPIDEEFCVPAANLFDRFAQRCAFPIHACVVRTALVQGVGGFDPSLKVSADWTMWQRVARRGARFGYVPTALARYHRRAGSITSDLRALFAAAVRTITLGHSPDPVAGLSDDAPYASGRLERPDHAIANSLCWAAGGMLALGQDPSVLLTHLPSDVRSVDVDQAAACIVHAAPIALGRPSSAWRTMWSELRAPLEAFLHALEQSLQRPAAGRRILAAVQRDVLIQLELPLPDPVPGTVLKLVRITEPFDDIQTAPGVERVQLLVRLLGTTLGVVELETEGARIPERVVRDAVATRFAWIVLGRLFERTRYADVELRRDGDGWSAWRGELRLAHGLPHEPRGRLAALHDAIGWHSLLDELWEPDHPLYARVADLGDRVAARFRGRDDGRQRGAPRTSIVQVGGQSPAFRIGRRNLACELRVGAEPVAALEIVPGPAGFVSRRQIRRALVEATDFELCRLVVRDLIFGAPLDGVLLRHRLARLAGHVRAPDVASPPLTRVATVDLTERGLPLRVVDLLDSDDLRAATRVLVTHGAEPLAWVTLPAAPTETDAASIEDALLASSPGSLRDATRRRLARGAPPVAGRDVAFTVVVCTRDRTDSLERCLASLRDVDCDVLEVLVVDNAPTSPRTAELVASMSAEFRAPRTLRYAREDRPGLDWARNRGIAEASHPFIAFTDDDVRVDAGWLRGLASGFTDPSVMMVTGFVAPAELASRAQIDFEDGYGGMGKGFVARRWQREELGFSERLGAHHLGVGANMAFRRELLQRIGGFDTALDVGTPSHGAGDLEMFHRVLVSGAVAHYEPSALVWHSHRRDRAGLARQLRDNGRAFGVYLLGCAIRRTVPATQVARYATIRWLGWLVGRLARSLVGRDPMPVALRAAELWGAMQAPWAYWATRRSDRSLRRGASNG